MANYTSYYRTNYFQVTEKEKLEKILQGFPDVYLFENTSEDGTVLFGFGGYDALYCAKMINFFSIKDIEYAGGCIPAGADCSAVYFPIEDAWQVSFEKEDTWIDDKDIWISNEKISEYYAEMEEDSYCEFDLFVNELQKILPENEICIFYEVGYEKLRYLNADACFITKSQVQYLNFSSIIEQKAKEVTENPEYTPKLTY